MFENLNIKKFVSKFYIKRELEDYNEIIDNIEKGIVYKGTNLWILIFAIFVASLGLNINSTAVIIGAMLISPLMGPIIGMGLGIGRNDFIILKKSFNNYLVALIASLCTSTLYFIISPLNEAHSEILARTSPTIYDVLIAFFGGMAGAIATTSKNKGNVIPGVAIATALMPPLCTAGYGIATLNLTILLGALYLFFINTVFIGIATFLTMRFVKIPFKEFPEESKNRKTKRLVFLVATITILPSIYFGYRIVQVEKFNIKAKNFIDNETKFKNAFLLKTDIDASKKIITLTYGGGDIDSISVKNVESKMRYYDLGNTTLKIQQGFSFANKDDKLGTKNDNMLSGKNNEIFMLSKRLDSIQKVPKINREIIKELRVLYPQIKSVINDKVNKNYTDSLAYVSLVIVEMDSIISDKDVLKIQDFLNLRLKLSKPQFLFSQSPEYSEKLKNIKTRKQKR